MKKIKKFLVDLIILLFFEKDEKSGKLSGSFLAWGKPKQTPKSFK